MIGEVLGLSESAWQDVFSLLNVFLPGLVMICFGAYYELRKKAEIAIKVGISRLRVAAYADIAETYGNLIEEISPTLDDEAIIKVILGYWQMNELRTDYSRLIGTEKEFDSFYKEICHKERLSEIYLDYKVKKQCRNSISLFSEMKCFLDAFRDTERAMCGEGNTEKIQHRIDFAYQLSAILFQNEINKSSILLGDVIAEQIKRASITYKKFYFDRLKEKLWEIFFRCFEPFMRKNLWNVGFFGKIALRGLGDRVSLIYKIPLLVDSFAYLHCADKYTASEFFQMDKSEWPKESVEFMQFFYLQMHHNK